MSESVTNTQSEPTKKFDFIAIASAIGVAIAVFATYYVGREYLLTESMKASSLSLGIFSRIGFFGYILLLGMLGLLLFKAYIKALAFGAAGVAILYFSFFGALDMSVAMGPDTFVKTVVAEQGCFPEKWISIAADHGATLPSQEQLCGS